MRLQLDVFEGPLDLLLHLIKVNELEISEISISAITEQYLDTLRLMEELDLRPDEIYESRGLLDYGVLHQVADLDMQTHVTTDRFDSRDLADRFDDTGEHALLLLPRRFLLLHTQLHTA